MSDKYVFRVQVDDNVKTIEAECLDDVVDRIYLFALNHTRDVCNAIKCSDMSILLDKYEIPHSVITGRSTSYEISFVGENDKTCYKGIELLEFIFPIIYHDRTLKIIDKSQHKKICPIQ